MKKYHKNKNLTAKASKNIQISSIYLKYRPERDQKQFKSCKVGPINDCINLWWAALLPTLRTIGLKYSLKMSILGHSYRNNYVVIIDIVGSKLGTWITKCTEFAILLKTKRIK